MVIQPIYIYSILGAIIVYMIYQIAFNDWQIPELFTSELPKSDVIINIKNKQFNPNFITIPTGTRVTWINLDTQGDKNPVDAITHQIDLETAKSPELALNQSWSYQFDEPKTYTYTSIPHGSTGTIIVSDNGNFV